MIIFRKVFWSAFWPLDSFHPRHVWEIISARYFPRFHQKIDSRLFQNLSSHHPSSPSGTDGFQQWASWEGRSRRGRVKNHLLLFSVEDNENPVYDCLFWIMFVQNNTIKAENLKYYYCILTDQPNVNQTCRIVSNWKVKNNFWFL